MVKLLEKKITVFRRHVKRILFSNKKGNKFPLRNRMIVLKMKNSLTL